MLDESYPKIGQSGSGHQRYELDVYDFLQVLDPPKGFDLSRIDPNDYFVTSGDAIQKTQYLTKVLWENAGNARRQLNDIEEPNGEQIEFESDCWKQAGAVRRLMNALLEAKDKNVFLETEWKEHRLIVIPKNPRLRKNKACQTKQQTKQQKKS